MTVNYEPFTSMAGTDFIRRANADGSFSDIPVDEANSDYQAYLNPVEHLTEIPTPPAE